jgi:3-isopropylmalate/(R)-2-methylmalate dehydratase small subunit
MTPVSFIRGRAVAIPHADIDTDQIIPARYLKVTDKEGLGEALFCDWRFDANGSEVPNFPLNRPEARRATILIAGHNFGCGSSREHAPWALLGYGFKAIISTQFADIFRENALKNGLVPVVLDRETHERLIDLTARESPPELEIDIAAQILTMPDGTHASFPLDPFSKTCLLEGIDELGYLLSQEQAIAEFERGREMQEIRMGL